MRFCKFPFLRFGPVLILALVHMVSDCYLMFLPALWLPLAHAFDLSSIQTGCVISIAFLPGNLMQPIYGLLADRFDAKWLVVIGPLMVVLCMSLLGLSNALWLTLLLLLIGSMGSGMFHPEAARLASRFSATGSSRAMSLFLGGGFLGSAIGPAWISATISGTGRELADSWQTIFPGLVVVLIGVVMVARLPSFHSARHANRQPSWTKVLAGRTQPISCLFGISFARAFAIQMLIYTLPMYLQDRSLGQMAIGRWMAIFLGAQGVGILCGGMTSPRHRERVTLIGSLLIVLLPVWLLPFLDAPVSLVALAATGLGAMWTLSVTIQLGQSIVQHGQRWVAGILMGFSWGIGALIAPPLAGYLCDQVSTQTSLMVGAAALTVAFGFSMALPLQCHLNKLKIMPDSTS